MSQYEQWETLKNYILLNISEILWGTFASPSLHLKFCRGPSPADSVPLSFRIWACVYVHLLQVHCGRERCLRHLGNRLITD